MMSNTIRNSFGDAKLDLGQKGEKYLLIRTIVGSEEYSLKMTGRQ